MRVCQCGKRLYKFRRKGNKVRSQRKRCVECQREFELEKDAERKQKKKFWFKNVPVDVILEQVGYKK